MFDSSVLLFVLYGLYYICVVSILTSVMGVFLASRSAGEGRH